MTSKRLFQIDVDMNEIDEYARLGKIQDLKKYQLTDAMFYSKELGEKLHKETVRFSCVYEINPENNPDLTRFFKSVYNNPMDNNKSFERTMSKKIDTEEYYNSVSLKNPDKMTSRLRVNFRYRGHKFILDNIDGQIYLTVTNDFMSQNDEEITSTKRGKIFHKLDAISNSLEIDGEIEDIILRE